MNFVTTGWQYAEAICFLHMLRYNLKFVRLKITDCRVVWEKENPCYVDVKFLNLLDTQPGRNAKFPKGLCLAVEDLAQGICAPGDCLQS